MNQSQMQNVYAHQPQMQNVYAHQPQMQNVYAHQPQMQNVYAHQPQMQNVYADMLSYLTEPSWLPVISPYLQIPQQCVMTAYANGEQIFPAPHQIFAAFNAVPLQKVKVVIVGQDPYTNVSACGLAFSAPPGSAIIPPSLRNIFKCIQNDPKITFAMPNHGDLSSWTQQGVLLLNTSFTVGLQSASHANFGWKAVTNNVIEQISITQEHVVFILLGRKAQAKSCYIDQSKHSVLSSYHPKSFPKYFQMLLEAEIFSACNAALISHGQTPINWQIR